MPEIEQPVPYVAMAWSKAEHDDPEEILEGCLLVVADTHEAAYDEIKQQLEEIGGSIDEYAVVIRRAK